MPRKHCEKNLWLLKPFNENQGRGIILINNLLKFKEFACNKNSYGKWIIQKYIERPLLYKGRKFDIRIWVLLTGRRDIFICKQGYIRTSSEFFNLTSMQNYVHLTNNCLQQNNPNYNRYEPGNTLSFSEFISNLDIEYNNKLLNHFDEIILQRVTDLIIDSILSVKKNSLKKHNSFCFEFLGYDFILDEDLRVWLIEINSNPYLGTPNKYIENILPKVISELLSLILDPYYPSNIINQEINESSKLFKLIYCEKSSNYSKDAINERTPFFISNIYPFQNIDLRLLKNIPLKKDNNIKNSIISKITLIKNEEALIDLKKNLPNQLDIEVKEALTLYSNFINEINEAIKQKKQLVIKKIINKLTFQIINYEIANNIQKASIFHVNINSLLSI